MKTLTLSNLRLTVKSKYSDIDISVTKIVWIYFLYMYILCFGQCIYLERKSITELPVKMFVFSLQKFEKNLGWQVENSWWVFFQEKFNSKPFEHKMNVFFLFE